MDRSIVQAYINNFRRRLTPFLKPGLGLQAIIHPADEGAILEFKIGPSIENDDRYLGEKPSLGKALEGVEQHAFAGNLGGFKFGGTNVILEQDKIIFIKDATPLEWNDAAAERDALRIVRSGSRASK